MKKLTEFDKKKMRLALMELSALFSPILVITVAYSMIAKTIFGENYYIAILLAGIIGGSWSLAMSKGYDLFDNTLKKTEKSWYSKATYERVLQKSRKIAYTWLFIFFIEIILIWIFKL